MCFSPKEKQIAKLKAIKWKNTALSNIKSYNFYKIYYSEHRLYIGQFVHINSILLISSMLTIALSKIPVSIQHILTVFSQYCSRLQY
jgi:hypothetical protein